MPASTAVRQRRAPPRPQLSILDQPPPFSVRKFSVEEYHALIDAGILVEGDPYELLDGWIVPKMPKNPPHEVCIELLQTVLGRLLKIGWRLRLQSAITLSTSEPEPDGAVVSGSPRDSLAHHPTPAEIALVIEVAESTLARDRRKAVLYARDRIARYWIINLVDRIVEDHSLPIGRGEKARYRTVHQIAADGVLTLTLGKTTLQIPVADLLP